MAGMDLEARCSSGTRSFRLVLLSFPHFSSGQTWPIIRRESSNTSFSTLSDGRGGKEDRKIKFKNEVHINMYTSLYVIYVIYYRSLNTVTHSDKSYCKSSCQ